MSRKFGWDLPPGVQASDIPGNRPEDEAWEKMVGDFYGSLNAASQKTFDDQHLEGIISEAIEFGIECGVKQQIAAELEKRQGEDAP